MPARALAPRPTDAPSGGYRRVLTHKTFVGYIVMNAALIGIGFSLLGDIFPAFAKNTAHVSEQGIGLCFLANTLVIVVVQLPVAKWLEGRRRMAAYGLEGTIWAAAWLIVFAGGWWLSGSAAADLARPGFVGRYLALNGFAFQLGGAAGRAIGGFALATMPHGLWLLAAAAAIAGGGLALLLERFIPPALRRTPVAVPA